MFELTDSTPATIVSVTLRRERHGEDPVPAASIGFKLTAANTILDQLSAGLLPMFYAAPQQPAEQAEFEEAKVVHLPLLRSAALDVINLKLDLDGWRLHVDYGIDDASGISLGRCKVDKFRFSLSEGGSVELRFRVGTSAVDETSMGKLGMLIDREVMITLRAPDQRVQPIDGTQAAFDAAHSENGGPWPFGDKGENNAPATKKRSRKKDATEAFLEAHGEAEAAS